LKVIAVDLYIKHLQIRLYSRNKRAQEPT